MKNIFFIIFFSIFFGLYLLLHWYLFRRGMTALEGTSFRQVFPWVFWGLALSFIAGQILERGNPTLAGNIIAYAGSLWLGLFLYFMLFTVLADLIRLADHWMHFIPAAWTSSFLSGKWIFTGISSVSMILVLVGYINAANPRIHRIQIDLDKAGNAKKEFKVVLATDLHMGAIIGNRRIGHMVDKINALKPDIVLFGGDLVDQHPLPVYKKQMGKNFLRLQAPMGVYAITGNHEFYGDYKKSIEYMEQSGVKYLQDTSINIDNELILAGRDDREKSRMTGKARKPLKDVLDGQDLSLPVILMDHQPYDYAQAASDGVDLMLSGHTHRGQMWPLNNITNAIFELDYGLMKKNGTFYYVSSGFGTWGPPVRLGNRPEIVEFTIKLK